nr:hypothetical protein [Tanacetum cinerariifolium]
MRRVGKGFLGVETPLFKGMLVGQEIKEGGDAEEHVEDVTASDNAQGDDTAAHGEVLTVTQEPSIPSPTPPTPSPQPPQDLPSISHDDDVALMDDKEEDKKDEEAKVVDIVTTAKLITEAVTTASEIVTTASIIIAAVEPFLAATITATPVKVDTAPSKRRKEVTNEQIEEEDTKALQIINETPAKKAAKSRKLNKEVEDLKRHLEIVPDKDDDVYTEATPLLRKNFNREDLEALWSLVKERFSTSNPKNFSDDFLLTTLGTTFEKSNGQAQVWKNQNRMDRLKSGRIKGLYMVKSWKLLELCGVHIITFTTMQLILLVERSSKDTSLSSSTRSLTVFTIRSSVNFESGIEPVHPVSQTLFQVLSKENHQKSSWALM